MLPPKFLIYGIFNAANPTQLSPKGKCYIGQSKNFRKRKGEHFSLLRQNKHKNIYLQRAWNKYGESNFICDVVEHSASREVLTDLENKWISFYKSAERKFGYNLIDAQVAYVGKQMKMTLTETLILEWVADYKQKTGEFPNLKSGLVEAREEYRGITWVAVNSALENGLRGLSGGITLFQTIMTHYGLKFLLDLEDIKKWILQWRDEKGYDPASNSEIVPYATQYDSLTWIAVDTALRHGLRGLPGGSSLFKVKKSLGESKRKPVQRRGVPHKTVFTTDFVLERIREYYRINGRFPTLTKPSKIDDLDITWKSIDSALREGMRGLGPNLSLKKLIEMHKQELM